MNKYTSYSTPRFGWLGEIPSHWEVKSLKYVFKPTRVRSKDGSEELLSVLIRKGVVRRRDILSEGQELTRSESLDGYIVCKKENLVNNIMKMGFYCMGISKYDGIVSPGYSVFEFVRPDQNVPQFWEYLLKTERYVVEYRKLSKGIQNSRMRLYDDYFLSIPTLVPPYSEQLEIVKFLDKKTEKIDELIVNKERKIELLKEKRISLIDNVVTKGLNSEVEVKESGFDWLGSVPVHWDVVRLNVLGLFSKGKGITRDDIKTEGYPCVRCGEIYTTYERTIDKVVSFIDEDTTQQSLTVDEGTLLFTGDGETVEEIGKCVVYTGNEPLYVGGGINVFTPKRDKVNPIWMSYVMNSHGVIFQKSRDGKGEIVVHIYSKQLKDIRIGLPSLDEQQEIVDYLNEQTKEIDDLIRLERRKIELLKEYRESIISEVVTGQVKVYDGELVTEQTV